MFRSPWAKDCSSAAFPVALTIYFASFIPFRLGWVVWLAT